MNAILPPSGNPNDYPTFNAQVPPEGPKVIAVSANFNTHSAYDLNLYQTQASATQRSVSSVFIDNSSNSKEVAVTVSIVNQTIKCPPNSQGYFTLFVPKNATITMSDPSAASTAIVAFMFTNFPVANSVWGAAGGLS